MANYNFINAFIETGYQKIILNNKYCLLVINFKNNKINNFNMDINHILVIVKCVRIINYIVNHIDKYFIISKNFDMDMINDFDNALVRNIIME